MRDARGGARAGVLHIVRGAGDLSEEHSAARGRDGRAARQDSLRDRLALPCAAGFRGKTNEPFHVRKVYEYVSMLKGVPMEEFAAAVKENVERVFGLEARNV